MRTFGTSFAIALSPTKAVSRLPVYHKDKPRWLALRQ
jgi:hypothetical protein